MEIDTYIEKKKNIENILLECLDCEEENRIDYYENFIFIIENDGALDDRCELTALLHLILEVSNNYKRSPHFFDRIEEILNYLSETIEQTYSNNEIFNIFKSNKRILLFLFESGIVKMNQTIANKMINKRNKNANYLTYFYPEIKDYLDDNTRSIVESEIHDFIQNEQEFEMFRKSGENHEKICELIRDDKVDEFVQYVNVYNISLSKTIEYSIFETNSILYKRFFSFLNEKPTLIEYAAFFGSIQIFKYLYFNEASINNLIWKYVIHGKNSDLVHFIEEKEIEPFDKNYLICLLDSVKCHHNDMANYFLNNYFESQTEKLNDVFIKAMKYYNYSFFLSKFDDKVTFYFLCQYDYATIVKILMKTIKFNINEKTILKFIYF